MIWARDLDFVPAINVTDRYTGRAEQLFEAGECLLGVQVFDRPRGERIVCPVTITRGDDVLHEGKTTGVDQDSNHLWEVVLKQGETYTVTITEPDGRTRDRKVETTAEANQRVDFFLQGSTSETTP
jgi:hypothetical protein